MLVHFQQGSYCGNSKKRLVSGIGLDPKDRYHMLDNIPLRSDIALIIGRGKVATHFKNYFSLLNVPFSSWDRSQSESQLKDLYDISSRVFLAVSDSALGDSAARFCTSNTVSHFHFSGSQEIPNVMTLHPLMTFSDRLYDLETYEKIPFVTTQSATKEKLIPGLKNPVFILPDSSVLPRYHLACSMMSNFSIMLWSLGEKLFADLGLDRKIFMPLLEKTLENFSFQGTYALTGPISRKDKLVVQQHLQELSRLVDPQLREHLPLIYQAFLKTYWPDFGGPK
jgi:hypothetical protein